MTEKMEHYDPTGAARALEFFVVEDLSKWWLRRSRSRFQRPQSPKTLEQSLGFLRYLLNTVARLLAPFAPYLAEEVHTVVGDKEKHLSIHLADWPEISEKLIDKELERKMGNAQTIVNLVLAIRKQKNLKVRQPLAQLLIKGVGTLDQELVEIVREEINVKMIADSDVLLVEAGWEANTGEGITVALDTKIDEALRAEGLVRELLRQLQDLRKKFGYEFSESVRGGWQTDNADLIKVINEWSEIIKSGAQLTEFKLITEVQPKGLWRKVNLGDGLELFVNLKHKI